MSQVMRGVVLSAAFLVALSLSSVSTNAQQISGRIELIIYKAGFIVGVSGGEGILNFRGRRYPLAIGGISLGATIGASKADLVGEVYNLRTPADIAGTYTSTQAGVAIAGGAKVAQLKNSKGVVLKVSGKQIGLEFSLDLSGIQISLK